MMTGVRQGCILSPVLFALAIDWVMRTALTDLNVGLQWTDGSRLSDLDYADDIVLLETSRDRMQQLTETVETEGKKIGLQINVKKCKTLVLDSWEDSREIRIRGTEVENVEDFFSAIWAAGYQPMAVVTKTVKSRLAKPAVCLEGYKMYRGTNTSA